MVCRHGVVLGDCACSCDLRFTVVVGFSTHDDVKAGRCVIGYSTVHILAPTDTAATLAAAQMVAGRGVMPTSTTVTDCVA